jgi:nucleosome binding factor SPN SPT16 subunit
VPENFGHGIGLEMVESQLTICKGNKKVVKEGNVFCLKLAFKEI